METTPESVEEDHTGADILNEVAAFTERFMAFPSDAARDAVALWIAHTHATDKERRLVFESTPRLAVLSDIPQCGKTLLMTLVELMSARAVLVTQPTAPALVTLIRDERASVLLDEIDLLFGPGNGQRDMRSILNSGYKRSGKTARANGVIYTFAPVALGGMAQNFCTNGKLEATRQRAIMIRLRQAFGERETYLSRLHDGMAEEYRDALMGWAAAHAAEIMSAWPDAPDGVDGRTEEIWMPLLQIAEVAGGDWPKRADAACRALALGDGSDAPVEPTPLLRLLGDLPRVLGAEETVTSADLVEALYALPEGRWRKLWPNAGLAPRELAALLRPLRVAPVKVRKGERTFQGYRVADLVPHLPEHVPARTPADQQCSGVPDDSL